MNIYRKWCSKMV